MSSTFTLFVLVSSFSLSTLSHTFLSPVAFSVFISPAVIRPVYVVVTALYFQHFKYLFVFSLSKLPFYLCFQLTMLIAILSLLFSQIENTPFLLLTFFIYIFSLSFFLVTVVTFLLFALYLFLYVFCCLPITQSLPCTLICCSCVITAVNMLQDYKATICALWSRPVPNPPQSVLNKSCF